MYAQSVAVCRETYIFENEDCRCLHVPDANTCSAVDYTQQHQHFTLTDISYAYTVLCSSMPCKNHDVVLIRPVASFVITGVVFLRFWTFFRV